MRRRSFLLGTIALGAGCGQVFDVDPRPGAPEIAFEDHMPAFFAFWDGSVGLPDATRRARFEAEIRALQPALYAPPVLRARHEERLDRWLDELGDSIEDMRTTHARFLREQEAAQSRFTSALPDFDWRGRVILYASASPSVGAARMLDGEPAILLSVDAAAMQQRDLVLSLHHELFHMYQAPGGENLAEALWVEGLATYASLALTPGRGDGDALPTSHQAGQVVSLDVIMPARVADLGPALRAQLRAPTSGPQFATYFAEHAPTDTTPSRSGFWFGLTLVRRIARGRSLQELAALEPNTLLDEIDRELAALVSEA